MKNSRFGYQNFSDGLSIYLTRSFSASESMIYMSPYRNKQKLCAIFQTMFKTIFCRFCFLQQLSVCGTGFYLGNSKTCLYHRFSTKAFKKTTLPLYSQTFIERSIQNNDIRLWCLRISSKSTLLVLQLTSKFASSLKQFFYFLFTHYESET